MQKNYLGSTYRIQLNDGIKEAKERFTLADATALLDYLDHFGIETSYLSPIWAAVPGSNNPYAVVNPNEVDSGLGGMPAFEEFSTESHKRDMNVMLDIVPNHMSTDALNAYWWSLLEEGEASPYAEMFEIEWDKHNRKVLIPILGQSLDETLQETNEKIPEKFVLRAVINPDTGRLEAKYWGNRFPITRADEVKERADAAADPKANGDVAAYLNAPENRHIFKELLERQHYRLASWTSGFDGDFNYRRFFDINDLVGMRQEIRWVFEETHKLLKDLKVRRLVDAVRVDHPDGMARLNQYFERLRELLGDDAVIEIEKILGHGEKLRHWPTNGKPIDGTTGYDGLNEHVALYTNSKAKPDFDRIYEQRTGNKKSFAKILHDSKANQIATAFASEESNLLKILDIIKRQDTGSRKISDTAFKQALPEVLCSFDVYRTYNEGGEIDPADAAVLQYVRKTAKESLRSTPHGQAVDFIVDALAGNLKGNYYPADIERFVRKMQQLTGPVVAKGTEDTAFYVYGRLLGGNEVGNDPERFGTTLADHHLVMKDRLAEHPDTMVTSSTHDTKRSEDARNRMLSLSEMPRDWDRQVKHWFEMNDVAHGEHGPSLDDEYFLYQTMIGAWPDDLRADDADGLKQFAGKMKQYMLKAIREAKTHTSWTRFDDEARNYERDFIGGKDEQDNEQPGFIDKILDPANTAFLNSFRVLQQRAARVGSISSIGQVVLKCMEPGVPDFYQGSEFWLQTLVDPDNRGPVDFKVRQELLSSWEKTPETLSTLRRDWHDGHIKFWVEQHALYLRKDNPELFARGAYDPLVAETPLGSDHLLAFQRAAGDARVFVAVPVLIADATDQVGNELMLTKSFCAASRLLVPDLPAGTVLTNILTMETLTVEQDGVIPLNDALSRLPAAIFTTDAVKNTNRVLAPIPA